MSQPLASFLPVLRWEDDLGLYQEAAPHSEKKNLKPQEQGLRRDSGGSSHSWGPPAHMAWDKSLSSPPSMWLTIPVPTLG